VIARDSLSLDPCQYEGSKRVAAQIARTAPVKVSSRGVGESYRCRRWLLRLPRHRSAVGLDGAFCAGVPGLVPCPGNSHTTTVVPRLKRVDLSVPVRPIASEPVNEEQRRAAGTAPGYSHARSSSWAGVHSQGPAPEVLEGHRLFIDNDRESAGNIPLRREWQTSQVLWPPSTFAIVGNHWDSSFANPLVAGSSPARPTVKALVNGSLFPLVRLRRPVDRGVVAARGGVRSAG
jgi:hypothetical protein